MSGDRRWVPIPVDDDRTDFIAVYEHRGDDTPGEQSELLRSFTVPVPPDDRLARLVDEVCGLASCHVGETMFGGVAEESYRDIAALRAAFQLGEES